MMWKLLSRAVSPGGQRGNLSVLIFHRVLAAPDPLAPWEPTAARFEAVLSWLKGQVNFLPLDEAVQRLRAGTLPPAAAAVTFDDGYRDNFEIAAPLLRRLEVPATFFVAGSFLDDGIMWNDVVFESLRMTTRETVALAEYGLPALDLGGWPERRAAVETVLKAIKYLPLAQRAQAVADLATACGTELPRDLMMSSEQLRSLAAMGFGIGAHTDTHPILARLPDDAAAEEIRRGRERLEVLLDRRINLFAYPNGHWQEDFDERHLAMVQRAGFDAAFSTEPGASRLSSNRFALPRFTPWDRQRWRFQARLITNMRRHCLAAEKVVH